MSGMIRAFYRRKLDEFKKLVDAHDLAYSFSDDPEVWESGEQSWLEIDKAARGLLPRDVTRIWNEKVAKELGANDEMYHMTEEQWKERTDA